MLCGLIRSPRAKAMAESFGFESRSSSSERTRKKVYMASY